MEWLILLAAFVYLSLAVIADSFDALLAWAADHPRSVIKAVGVGLFTGAVSALFKGQVTATLYIAAGSLAGFANIVYDWLKSYEST